MKRPKKGKRCGGRRRTCGAAADDELALGFFCHSDLRTATQGLTNTTGNTCLIGNAWVTLTRWVSSPGMVKLQVLEVDLEILLLSFFMWILHRRVSTHGWRTWKRHSGWNPSIHSGMHTCPVVLPLESWDWTVPLTSPPRSVDRNQSSSAHWGGWDKQRLSPDPVSLDPQTELQQMRQSFTSSGCVCLFGCRHSEDGERVPNVSSQGTWR